jgi:hypothetical protein
MEILCPPPKQSLVAVTATTGVTIAVATPVIGAVAAVADVATSAVATVAAADALAHVVARLVGDVSWADRYGCFALGSALLSSQEYDI